MFIIHYRGRKYRYETIEEAYKAASRVFDQTGIVVSIACAPSK